MGLFRRHNQWDDERASAPHPVRRGFIAGLTVGAVLVAAVAVAAASGWLGQRGASAADSRSPVLVVLEGQGQDGARVAVFTLVVKPDGQSALLDPSAALSIPGVSATTVRDASAFAGAGGIVAAVAPARVSLHWAEVEQGAWTEALGGLGPIKVTIPVAVDTFDGARVHSYHAGLQTVEAGDIVQLANAAQYLPARERKALLEELAGTVVDAIGATASPVSASATTDMSHAALAQVLAAAAGSASDTSLVSPTEGAF